MLLAALGAACVAVGVAMMAPAAGVVTAGLSMLAGAYVGAYLRAKGGKR